MKQTLDNIDLFEYEHESDVLMTRKNMNFGNLIVEKHAKDTCVICNSVALYTAINQKFQGSLSRTHHPPFLF